MDEKSPQEPSPSETQVPSKAAVDVSAFVKRKLNVKRDTFDPRDKVVFMTGPKNLPDKCYDLQPFLGPVRDQGDLGSCTGHAAMGMTELLIRKYFKWIKDQEIPADKVLLSALFQYYNERLMDGDVGSDDGSSGRTMMQALVKYGICLQADWPYDTKNFTTRPGDAMYQQALGYKPGAYHRVIGSDVAKSVIFSGYPFSISADVYASFMGNAAAKTGLIPIPTGREQLEGGHEFYAFAYDDTMSMADGSLGGFFCRNSWAENWGLNGNMWLPYSYIDNAQLVSDMWTVHFGPPWKRTLTLEQHAQLAV